jgi:hypothetical protein
MKELDAPDRATASQYAGPATSWREEKKKKKKKKKEQRYPGGGEGTAGSTGGSKGANTKSRRGPE